MMEILSSACRETSPTAAGSRCRNLDTSTLVAKPMTRSGHRPTLFSFPFNAAMFDGTMDLDEARHEHPEWVARLEREGRLDAATVPPPPVPLRILHFVFGYSIILLGLFLLVFAIANAALLTLF